MSLGSPHGELEFLFLRAVQEAFVAQSWLVGLRVVALPQAQEKRREEGRKRSTTTATRSLTKKLSYFRVEYEKRLFIDIDNRFT